MKYTDMFYMKVYKAGSPGAIVDLIENKDIDKLLDHKNEILEGKASEYDAEIISEEEYMELKDLIEPESKDHTLFYSTNTSQDPKGIPPQFAAFLSGYPQSNPDPADDEKEDRLYVLSFFANIGEVPKNEELDRILTWLRKTQK